MAAAAAAAPRGLVPRDRRESDDSAFYTTHASHCGDIRDRDGSADEPTVQSQLFAASARMPALDSSGCFEALLDLQFSRLLFATQCDSS